jgi:hypothetical protein
VVEEHEDGGPRVALVPPADEDIGGVRVAVRESGGKYLEGGRERGAAQGLNLCRECSRGGKMDESSKRRPTCSQKTEEIRCATLSSGNPRSRRAGTSVAQTPSSKAMVSTRGRV